MASLIERIGPIHLDASPHAYFPNSRKLFPMLNVLDDCRRLCTGSKIYQQEILLAYFDFLPQAFSSYGLPLALYVDYHTLFFSTTPEALTTLGQALRFYGITFRYAPTPQAKGKVEREHQYRQNRLPASRVVLCQHPSGHHSILTHHPKPATRPVIPFSNLPH